VAAGPAVVHGAIVEEFAANDLPCADSQYLVPLKRSKEFRALRPRLAGSPPHPVFDSWFENDFHFFAFVLAPNQDAGPKAEGGLAVFTMHRSTKDPVAAVAVVPTGKPNEAEITNLREPGGSYIAPIRPESDNGQGES
jgi:hypothetical protein